MGSLDPQSIIKETARGTDAALGYILMVGAETVAIQSRTLGSIATIRQKLHEYDGQLAAAAQKLSAQTGAQCTTPDWREFLLLEALEIYSQADQPSLLTRLKAS